MDESIFLLNSWVKLSDIRRPAAVGFLKEKVSSGELEKSGDWLATDFRQIVTGMTDDAVLLN